MGTLPHGNDCHNDFVSMRVSCCNYIIIYNTVYANVHGNDRGMFGDVGCLGSLNPQFGGSKAIYQAVTRFYKGFLCHLNRFSIYGSSIFES